MHIAFTKDYPLECPSTRISLLGRQEPQYRGSRTIRRGRLMSPYSVLAISPLSRWCWMAICCMGGPPWSVHGFTIVQRRRWYLLPRMLMFQRQASASRLQYPCRRLSYPATAIESGFARLGASARMAISSCQPFHTLRVLACFKSTPLGTTRQMRFLKSRILPPLV